jgi:hypothetical protein
MSALLDLGVREGNHNLLVASATSNRRWARTRRHSGVVQCVQEDFNFSRLRPTNTDDVRLREWT